MINLDFYLFICLSNSCVSIKKGEGIRLCLCLRCSFFIICLFLCKKRQKNPLLLIFFLLLFFIHMLSLKSHDIEREQANKRI